MPYPVRTTVRPLPLTSHANPKRGARLLKSLSTVLKGTLGSPGNRMPRGASGFTVDCVPNSHDVYRPYSCSHGNHGSYRNPTFIVIRGVSFHSSWMKNWCFQRIGKLSAAPKPWLTVSNAPSMKSAKAEFDRVPVNVALREPLPRMRSKFTYCPSYPHLNVCAFRTSVIVSFQCQLRYT